MSFNTNFSKDKIDLAHSNKIRHVLNTPTLSVLFLSLETASETSVLQGFYYQIDRDGGGGGGSVVVVSVCACGLY